MTDLEDDEADPAITGRMETPFAAPFVTEAAFAIPERPLARGGMAVVYLADDRRLPRQVILKRPRAEEDLPAEDRRAFVERLEAEALILARLQHPAIVTLYELGRATGGTPFCVLERVEGKSLRAKLDALKRAEDDGEPQTGARLELVTGLVGIAEAMAYAHDRGIVHRDVTPGNILLGSRGEMTLIDWGLAKDTNAAASENAVLASLGEATNGTTISAGTPPYVCFEQTQGEPADPKYDVYSLGVVLYEVVSGQPAYDFVVPEDEDAQRYALEKFLRWAQRGPVSDPASPRDAELSGIIARAMARDPAQRFTADELVRALKQYLTGDLVFSHRYSLTGRMARWVRRHRGAAIGFAIAIAAIVAAGLVWTTGRARDAERAQESARDEALVLAQKVEAAEAKTRASEADKRAREAEAAADQARRDGKESKELQAEAERLRKVAEREADKAKRGADDAVETATEAQARWQKAITERDAAIAAQSAADADRSAAERARDTAQADATAAIRERDASRTAAAAAEAARTTAIDERDAAVTARTQAEAQRTSAEKTRSDAEAERDAALARVRTLEERIRELESHPPPPPAAADAGP